MKLLLAVSSEELSGVSVNFACYIANLTKSKLTGLFLEEKITEVVHEEEATSSANEPTNTTTYAIKKPCGPNISRFVDACTIREAKYNIQETRCVSVKDLVVETRFADLLIISAKQSFADVVQSAPTKFIKRLLAEAECPIVIAPESDSNTVIKEILFAYDGNPSSVFAIKQFTYLFPCYRDVKLHIVEVSKNGAAIGEHYKIREWAKEYYTNVFFEALSGDEESRLLEVMLGKENTMVIMGAYGREGLSALMKKSHAEPLIKVITQPIFIAHH